MLSVKQDSFYNMNRMGALFEEKMLLRKKVDYREECFFQKKKNCSSMNGLLRKVQLIHKGKAFLLGRPDFVKGK